VSNSMLVKDMGEDMSRLERARWKIMDLVDELGRDPVHRVGLMPFAGEPFELAPPTPDYDAIRFFVEDIGPGSVAVGGSNLARAIDRAAEILDRLPGKQDSILVISDGDAIDENEPGAVQAWREAARRKAVAAARDARLKGIRVFALGVGGSAAGEVTAPDGPGGTSYVRFRDESGQERIATSALSEATLAAVAAGAGPGQMDGYVRTTRDDSDIRFLLARGLVAGGASGTSDEERSIPIDRFRWPLLAAFVLLLAELFVPEAGPRHRDEDDGDMKGAGP